MTASAEQRRRRAERVERTLALAAQGVPLDEIAATLGISPSTAARYQSDPDGSKQRRWAETRPRGTCEVCGAETSAVKFRRCPACAQRNQSGPRETWTRERIVEALKAWNLTYGEPPGTNDWSSTTAYPERAARYRRLRQAGLVPSFATAAAKFGSWNAALAVAGLPTRPHGGQKGLRRQGAHCIHGHPFDKENTYVTSKGARVCRTCKQHYQRTFKARTAARARGIILGPPGPPPKELRPGTLTPRWGRDEIIEAIRRFAAEHGRPPTTTDWKVPKSERGDYPHATLIYRTRSHPSRPFELWSDAIVAAGFPRPHRSGPRPGQRKPPTEGGDK